MQERRITSGHLGRGLNEPRLPVSVVLPTDQVVRAVLEPSNGSNDEHLVRHVLGEQIADDARRTAMTLNRRRRNVASG